MRPPVIVDFSSQPIRLSPGVNAIPIRTSEYSLAPHERVATGAVYDESDRLVARTEAPLGSDTLFLDLPDSTVPGRYRVEVAVGPPLDRYVEQRPAAVFPDVSVTPGLRVGVIRSYDNTTVDALRQMGASVVLLDSTDLAHARFDSLHTVVVDIRAYLVRPDLRAHNAKLLHWVRKGGHLVVNYHKTFEWNPGQQTGGFFDAVVEIPDEGFAPYPLLLSRDRVTHEDAPVELLQPSHVVFHTPHEITESDWAAWVQERGLYFPTEYDTRYQELVAMNDPGEAPLGGGLLLANVGTGTYLYTSLVFYRQLEALNAGAWRLFANVVSLPLTHR